MLDFCGKLNPVATTQECIMRSVKGWSPGQMFNYFWNLEVLIVITVCGGIMQAGIVSLLGWQ